MRERRDGECRVCLAARPLARGVSLARGGTGCVTHPPPPAPPRALPTPTRHTLPSPTPTLTVTARAHSEHHLFACPTAIHACGPASELRVCGVLPSVGVANPPGLSGQASSSIRRWASTQTRGATWPPSPHGTWHPGARGTLFASTLGGALSGGPLSGGPLSWAPPRTPLSETPLRMRSCPDPVATKPGASKCYTRARRI